MIIMKINFTLKMLTALLFHNDEDLVEDQIIYYGFKNKQDLIVFIHNSTDDTNNIVMKYKNRIKCIYYIPETFIFKYNQVHEVVYETLLGKRFDNVEMSDPNNDNYSEIYDWISFPESDEFLEGYNRRRHYYRHLYQLHKSKNINKIAFRNFIYWFTEKDNMTIKSPVKRIRYYCLKKKSKPRIYAWRGNHTIKRFFGHKSDEDLDDEIMIWNSRHYEVRSKKHLYEKSETRKDVSIGMINYHYNLLYEKLQNDKTFGDIKSNQLHYDNGSELNHTEIFDWKKHIY